MSRARLIQVCLGVLLVSVLAKATAAFEPFPGWDANPLTTVTAITGLGPTAGLVLDALAAIGAGLLIVLARHRCGWVGAIALLGGIGLVVRTLLIDAGDAEPLPIAGAWAAGCVAFAGGCVIAPRPSLRRAAVAVVIGYFCVLLAKSAGQLLVEHPAVVASFDLDPEGALASRGYEPGSAAALQFERRLRQPDITGWFGLANVLAAYLVAGAAACGAIAWQRRSHARTWAWRCVTLLGLLCVAGVLATGSKAGVAILLAASLAFGIAQMLTARGSMLLGIGVWLLPLAAVAGRGLLLPSEGELSLLFRWFYLETAVEISAGHLPWGVGPDGFRSAYALTKPAIAPETVTSAHNSLADWFAMLGVVGVPLVAACAVAVWGSAGLLRSAAGFPKIGPPARPAVLSLGVILTLPVVLNAYLEAEATPIELALVRLAGLGLGVLAAACVWTLRPGRATLGVLSLVLLTHAQLDMVLFHPGSIPLAMLVFGLSAPQIGPGGRSRWLGLLGVACAIALIWFGWKSWQWEAPLRRAFDAAQTVAVESERAQSWTSFDRQQFERLLTEQAHEIDAELQAAAAAMPRDPRAWLAVSDLRLSVRGPTPEAWQAAQSAVETEPTARTLGRLGRIALALAPTQADAETWVAQAREAWTQASALDPRSPHFPGLLAELELEYGTQDEALRWATEALRRHDNYRLDPLAGLPDDRRQRLEDLVKPAPPGS